VKSTCMKRIIRVFYFSKDTDVGYANVAYFCVRVSHGVLQPTVQQVPKDELLAFTPVRQWHTLT